MRITDIYIFDNVSYYKGSLKREGMAWEKDEVVGRDGRD
jgi:hypothetical protein